MQNSEISPVQPIPVYILAGFLGSGKTTLLARLLEDVQRVGKKAAVLMNEVGDVNLDGLAVDSDIPMKELLSGCICCTVSGDLGMELLRLSDEHQPDVIFVECSGVANPMELLEGVTEASLLFRMDVRGVVTVMDSAFLSEQLEKAAEGKGKTYRLLKDQLRAASLIVLNKIDLVSEEKLDRIRSLIGEWNTHTSVKETIRCELDPALIWGLNGTRAILTSEDEDTAKPKFRVLNESHSHVMVYTHYMTRPVDSEAFEAFMSEMPAEVYRAKGILTFVDTTSRFMFQYAYRQLDFLKIMPQREVPDVAVFIGENLETEWLRAKLEAL